MTQPLIIAGSAEGHALARALPLARAMLPAPLRHDPGDVGYQIAEEWTSEALISSGEGPVILATHPCDDSLRSDLLPLCQAAGRSVLHLIRPPWEPASADRWHLLDRDEDVGRVIPEGARLFVGLGRSVRLLEPQLTGHYLVIRQIGARGNVYRGRGHYLDTDAPVTVQDEVEMLRAERIDWLMVRNAGGAGAWPKLAAARTLNLPVAMLPRPALIEGVPLAETVEEAVQWLSRH